MSNPKLFRIFDTHVRGLGLGGSASEEHHGDNYVASLGQWFFVSRWSFEDDNLLNVTQAVLRKRQRDRSPLFGAPTWVMAQGISNTL